MIQYLYSFNFPEDFISEHEEVEELYYEETDTYIENKSDNNEQTGNFE